MKTVFKLLGLLSISHTVYAGVIYGVDQIENQYQRVRYPVYVQLGSFSTIRAAERFQHQIHRGTKVPVVIQSASGRYKVRVGPFHNQSALKTFASNKASDAPRARAKQLPDANLLQMPLNSVASIPLLKPMQTHASEEPTLPRQHPRATYALQQGSHPELSVFLGGSYIPNTIKGQTLQLMPYEIDQYADTFTNQSSGSAFTWGVDALYRFKLHAPSIENYFFDSLGAGIDVFQITNFNQTGKVLQFNMPEFENYTYTLKLNNIRVMANFDLDFHPVRHYFIPFVQAGLGGARTAISYNSAPISPVDSPNFTLPTEASWNFSYQAGAGVKYVAKPHVVLSLRYLYANMGKVNSSTSGSTTTLATPLTVDMSTQTFLFGLTYLIE
ncbi:MAG: outer membrane beta-barrel protein [Legionellaceae bacterium]|nr:outer membrane beta-barrel protein [Legionellaceae bacterium]